LVLNFFGRFIVLVTLLFIQPQPILAATLLTISDNLVLKEVNDKVQDTNFFSNENTIELPQGRHTLLVKYKDVFEDLDFAEERLVESDPFIIEFSLTNEKALLLSTPEIKNLTAAERFSHMPEIVLTTQAGQSLALDLMKYEDYKLAKQVNLAVNQLVTQQPTATTLHNNLVESTSTAVQTSYDSSEVAVQEAINRKNIKIDTEVNLNQTFNKEVTNHISTVPMLKYWWKKASNEEKQDFIHFINSQ
jgi:hypothetical protein